jgi:hypothetical protein
MSSIEFSCCVLNTRIFVSQGEWLAGAPAWQVTCNHSFPLHDANANRMIATRQKLSIAATGLAPAGIGMHSGMVLQARGNPPVFGARLAT